MPVLASHGEARHRPFSAESRDARMRMVGGRRIQRSSLTSKWIGRQIAPAMRVKRLNGSWRGKQLHRNAAWFCRFAGCPMLISYILAADGGSEQEARCRKARGNAGAAN